MQNLDAAALLGTSEDEINKLLSFVVVGGGPTGVEFTGELLDFIQERVSKYYPSLSNRVKVTLIDNRRSILTVFNKQLQEYAMAAYPLGEPCSSLTLVSAK
jgi:NADH:ubiquinone reductase (non-electrogenic)